jgi:hypothetical protein
VVVAVLVIVQQLLVVDLVVVEYLFLLQSDQ